MSSTLQKSPLQKLQTLIKKQEDKNQQHKQPIYTKNKEHSPTMDS